MKHAFIILLLLAVTFVRADEERTKAAEQIVKPLLQWIYFSELPPGAVTSDDRKEVWPGTVRDRLLKSTVQTAWVSVTIPGATKRFTFDIGQRRLTPTDITEQDFVRVHALGDGENGLYQYRIVRIHAAAETKGFEVKLDTGSICHGRRAGASFERGGQFLTLTEAYLRGVKCCF